MDAIGVALLLATLRLSVPLAIAAMGELVAERAGVLNIGIEGMMLAGAFAAFAVGATTGSVGLALAAGMLAGAALAALFALFVIGRNSDPIVCGMAINVLALGVTGSAYRVLLPAGASTLTSPLMPEVAPGVNGFVLVTALQMATVGSARILGFEQLLGRVEVDMLADLVVLSANPLEDISAVRRVELVVHQGRRRRP